MRRTNNGSYYASFLSGKGSESERDGNTYARQWAHDVRCVRNDASHRRVGDVSKRDAHTEWLQMGCVIQSPLKAGV